MKEVLQDCSGRDSIRPNLQQPGDVQLEQKNQEIHACQCPPNVLLHLEAFDFIFLQPVGHLANYFDSVFCNLRNNGLLCLTSSDISVQFTRTANVIRRYCHALVTKTDYMREMAVRVIIGSAVRSASRCNKGLEILLTACVEDNFLIVMRVHRGPQHADQSLDQVQPQLYCQICEERCFLPSGLTPVENPYRVLSCSCHEKFPGRTAVVLGPMWSGSIFNLAFIFNLLNPADDLPKLSDQLRKVLESIKEEALCSDSDVSETDGRDHSRGGEEPDPKRPKLCNTPHPATAHPPFYINIHKKKFKDIVIPKMRKVLSFLRSEGFRASRTHFDPNSVRTSANLTQFHDVLLKYCKKNQKE
uniref:TRMT1-like protein isoform X2 n=1 Tax=Crassostrea virginica TaxID=6565 RepID=A0A8B8DKC7_CRAVI|nr:TRMT1-like protein isoform X2 [Crassostrea virginica]